MLGEELGGVESMRDELMNAISMQQNEYDMMVKLNKQYNKHWETKEDKQND